VLVNIDIIVLV